VDDDEIDIDIDDDSFDRSAKRRKLSTSASEVSTLRLDEVLSKEDAVMDEASVDENDDGQKDEAIGSKRVAK
jgi:hypothetical protein